ncbi:MAG TPA: DUF4124 domain-containing protein [Gammaproteobacteria bacterium]|jgi:hypothetical protein|nr:DUF4124 domain-containing protein [Gammaproteobacteria bacterium]
MNKIALACGVMLALGTSLAAADQVYKWVDDQGHVHFSQTPPPGTKVQAQPVTVTPAPPDPQSLQNSQDLQKQVGDQNKAAQDAAAKNKPDPAKAAEKQAHCDDLRSKLQVLAQSGRAATTDAQGNLTYLDDTGRQQQEDEINKELASDCKGH